MIDIRLDLNRLWKGSFVWPQINSFRYFSNTVEVYFSNNYDSTYIFFYLSGVYMADFSVQLLLGILVFYLSTM